MTEFKIFLHLIKTNFKKLWNLFILMIICAIFANFLTILQPLIFASMIEIVLPNDFEFLNSQNNKTENIAEKSFFDLNYVGQKILVIIYGLFNIKDFSTLENLILFLSVQRLIQHM